MRYLASIKFEDGQDIDGLLRSIVREQEERGVRIRGVLQFRSQARGECHCADMDLLTLGSEKVFRISQPLGNGSRGCRLHPGALAACSAFLEEELEQGADLLLLNRFGRGESEGHGFRDLISFAVAQRIPVLTAVRATYLLAWEHFIGDFGATLPFDRRAINDWLSSVKRLHLAPSNAKM